MAVRIDSIYRVAKYIGVPIELLRVGWVGDNGIGRDEAVNIRQVVAGVVVDEAQVVVVFLSGVAAVGKGLGGRGALGAEGQVAGAAAADHAAPIVITHTAMAAQACAELGEAWSVYR